MSSKLAATRRFLTEQQHKLRKLRRASATAGAGWVDVNRAILATLRRIDAARERAETSAAALI